MGAIQNFLNYLKGEDFSPSSIESYKYDLARFGDWFQQTNGEPFTGSNLTETDGREYRQYLQLHKYAPGTINRKLVTLRKLADYQQIPFKVRGLKMQGTTIRWLNKRVVAALRRQLDVEIYAARTEYAKWQAVRNRAMVIILLNTGLRVSELCALTWDDLSISERKGQLIVREGKGRKFRVVPLNVAARDAFTAVKGTIPNCIQQVFCITPRTIERVLEDLSRKIDEEITPHQLRHTFVKSLLDSGASLEKIADLCGHEDLQTTRRYGKPSQQDLENTVGLLD